LTKISAASFGKDLPGRGVPGNSGGGNAAPDGATEDGYNGAAMYVIDLKDAKAPHGSDKPAP